MKFDDGSSWSESENSPACARRVESQLEFHRPAQPSVGKGNPLRDIICSYINHRQLAYELVFMLNVLGVGILLKFIGARKIYCT